MQGETLMKKIWQFAALFVVASTLLVSQAHAAGIAWRESVPEALKEAKRTNKPVFLDFAAEWCGPCQLMKKNTFTDKKVIAELRKWISVHVDVDQQEKVARQYGIEAMPTMIIVNPSGSAVAKTLGYHDASELLSWLRANYMKARR
jgi:thiol:disulfide interchange protein